MVGDGFAVPAYIRAKDDGRDIRAALNLDAGAPLLVAYTSTLDEFVDDCDATDIVPTQHAWVEALLAYGAGNPGVQVVIRVHPATRSEKSIGQNHKEMRYFEQLAAAAPANVLVIPSTADVNAYALMHSADAVATWVTTAGMEAAMLGRPVVQAGALPGTGDLPFLHRLRDGEALSDALDRALTPAPAEEVLRRAIIAWRYAYVRVKRRAIDLPLIRHERWGVGDFNFSNTDALAPGKDAGLDRVCGLLLGRENYVPSPDGHDGDENRESAAVRAFLDRFGWPRQTATREAVAV